MIFFSSFDMTKKIRLHLINILSSREIAEVFRVGHSEVLSAEVQLLSFHAFERCIELLNLLHISKKQREER